MAFEYVEVVILQCDQGMGSLIKIYSPDMSGDSVLSNLVLIDLGAELGAEEDAMDAVESVVGALEQMLADGVTPHIDLLVVSHQDYDHWSLLPDLMTMIQDNLALDDFYVGRVVTGGSDWRQEAMDEVRAFASTFARLFELLGNEYSDYRYRPPKQLAGLEGVVFRTLVVNTLVTRKALDLIRNGTSAVVALEAGSVNCIFPGDATANTIASILEIVSGFRRNPLLPCRVLSVPHHGSLRTIASNFRRKGANLDLATAFASMLQPEMVAASAGYLSQFNHPSKKVLDTLGVYSESVDAHDYVNFDDDINLWRPVKDATRGIYTTVLDLDDPPGRETWTFTIGADGSVSARRVRLGRPSPQPPPRLVALPPQERTSPASPPI
ncbi:MAG TPA: hypothetical protein VK721_06410 [Solirubrobacteraceae bacterium]|jgi:beta-lactamase superfamily II metal-dependent hydrolase|nr:hypothetical protein [Solirubrobacteraceae bacterium]